MKLFRAFFVFFNFLLSEQKMQLYVFLFCFQKPKIPYLLHKSTISEIWFKQDDEFRVPKLYVTFEVFK